METTKKWKTVAIFLSTLTLLPLLFYGPKIISSFLNPEVYTTVPSIDGKIPSITEVDNHSSEIVSLLLHAIWTISSIWFSLYIGNKIKSKLKMNGKNTVLSSILGSVTALIIFIIIYFVLSISLVDNRTAEGYPAYINFESITHLMTGIINGLIIFISMLFF